MQTSSSLCMPLMKQKCVAPFQSVDVDLSHFLLDPLCFLSDEDSQKRAVGGLVFTF